jgi:hypothetical protein
LQFPLAQSLIHLSCSHSEWICNNRTGFCIRNGGRQVFTTFERSMSDNNAGCMAGYNESEMDQFAPAPVLSPSGELMERYNRVSGNLQCSKQHHEHTVRSLDYHTGNNCLRYSYVLSEPTRYQIQYEFRYQSLINPHTFTPAYFLPTFKPYRKWILMHIMYSLVGHLYTTCTLCDY